MEVSADALLATMPPYQCVRSMPSPTANARDVNKNTPVFKMRSPAACMWMSRMPGIEPKQNNPESEGHANTEKRGRSSMYETVSFFGKPQISQDPGTRVRRRLVEFTLRFPVTCSRTGVFQVSKLDSTRTPSPGADQRAPGRKAS